MKELEASINKRIADIDVDRCSEWRVILVIASEEHKRALGMKETQRFTRRDSIMHFRVVVDYERARWADFNHCIDLLVHPLLSTLPYFKKAGIGLGIQQQLRMAVLVAAEESKSVASSVH